MMRKEHRIETSRGVDLTTGELRELADAYRFVFNNVSGHFLVFPSTDVVLSPKDFFGDQERRYFDLSILDGVSALPKHPETGEAAILWHHPETTFQALKQKLAGHDSYVSTVRNIETGILDGLTFGYHADLRTIFREEWEHPFIYSTSPRSGTARSEKTFYRQLKMHLPDMPLGPDTEMFCWNCAFTMPWARGLSTLLPMVRTFFQMLPEYHLALPNIQELTVGSQAHAILSGIGISPVPGILGAEQIIGVAPLSRLISAFQLPPRAFLRLVRSRELCLG